MCRTVKYRILFMSRCIYPPNQRRSRTTSRENPGNLSFDLLFVTKTSFSEYFVHFGEWLQSAFCSVSALYSQYRAHYLKSVMDLGEFTMNEENLKQLVTDGLLALKAGGRVAATATDEIMDAATNPELKSTLQTGNETSKE